MIIACWKNLRKEGLGGQGNGGSVLSMCWVLQTWSIGSGLRQSRSQQVTVWDSYAHFFLCLSDGIFITLVPSLRPFPCSIALLDQMVRELGWLGVEVQLGLQNHSAAYFVIEVSLKAFGLLEVSCPIPSSSWLPFLSPIGLLLTISGDIESLAHSFNLLLGWQALQFSFLWRLFKPKTKGDILKNKTFTYRQKTSVNSITFKCWASFSGLR